MKIEKSLYTIQFTGKECGILEYALFRYIETADLLDEDLQTAKGMREELALLYV